jgi:hypothetical protein
MGLEELELEELEARNKPGSTQRWMQCVRLVGGSHTWGFKGVGTVEFPRNIGLEFGVTPRQMVVDIL